MRYLVLLAAILACVGTSSPRGAGASSAANRRGAACDAALAGRFVYAVRQALAGDPEFQRLWPGVDTERIVVSTTPATCAAAGWAHVRAGGSVPDSLGVIALADSGYGVFIAGDMSGEWQMSYWFDARWAVRGPALGM